MLPKSCRVSSLNPKLRFLSAANFDVCWRTCCSSSQSLHFMQNGRLRKGDKRVQPRWLQETEVSSIGSSINGRLFFFLKTYRSPAQALVLHTSLRSNGLCFWEWCCVTLTVKSQNRVQLSPVLSSLGSKNPAGRKQTAHRDIITWRCFRETSAETLPSSQNQPASQPWSQINTCWHNTDELSRLQFHKQN